MTDAARATGAGGPGLRSLPPARSSRWLVLILLVLGYALYNLDKSIIAIMIEPLKAEFGLGDRQISLLSAGMTLPIAIFCIPMGRMIDRVNRKIMVALLVIGWSAMTGLSGLANSIVLLGVARGGVGAFESGYTPASMSLLADEFPPQQRPTAMGFFNLGSPVGICLGMAIGGLVAAHWGWRAAFFAAGFPGLLLGGIILLFVREPERGRFDHVAADARPTGLGRAVAIWWAEKPSRYAGLAMIFAAVLVSATSIWIPALLSRVQGLGIAQAGLLTAFIVGVCGSLGAATGGLLADRIGRTRESRKLLVPSAGLALSAVAGLAGYLLVLPLAPMVVLLSLSSFFASSYAGPGYAAALGFIPAQIRGTIASVLLLCFGVLSYGTGTMIVGFVSDLLPASFGVRAIAVGIASALPFSLVGAGLFAVAYRERRKTERASGDVAGDENV